MDQDSASNNNEGNSSYSEELTEIDIDASLIEKHS
jgi:hypothetical protein